MAAKNEPSAMPLRGTALLSSKQWSQGVLTQQQPRRREA